MVSCASPTHAARKPPVCSHHADKAVLCLLRHLQVLMSFGLGDRKASGTGFHWEAFMGFFRPLPLPALESYADRVIGIVGQQNPSPEGLQLLHGYTPQEVSHLVSSSLLRPDALQPWQAVMTSDSWLDADASSHVMVISCTQACLLICSPAGGQAFNNSWSRAYVLTSRNRSRLAEERSEG